MIGSSPYLTATYGVVFSGNADVSSSGDNNVRATKDAVMELLQATFPESRADQHGVSRQGPQPFWVSLLRIWARPVERGI